MPKNPLKWRFLQETSVTVNKMARLESTKAIAFPSFLLEKNKLLFNLYSIWYHCLPAILIDLFWKIVGKPPLLVKVYCKVYNINKLLMPFCAEKPIIFTSDNVNRLWQSLDPIDKALFNFDLKEVNWEHYMLQTMKGVRVYILNDPMDTLPEGRKLAFKLKIRKFIFDSLVWSGIICLLYFFFKDAITSLFIY